VKNLPGTARRHVGRAGKGGDNPTASPTDLGSDPYSCANWTTHIELAEKRDETFIKRGKKILKRYREERPEEETGAPRRMNVFWSNVETLQPCIYGREPVPIAERRFLDRDVVGRVASQVLERSMRYQMADCGFHDTVEQCVLDYLTVGRGVPWLRFNPIIGKSTSLTDLGDDEITDRDGLPGEDRPESEEEADETDARTAEIDTPEKLLSASLSVDYVHWCDFLTSNARFWKEVEWVARRLYPSRQDMVDDFGEDIGNAVPLEMTPENTRDTSGRYQKQTPDSLKKAIVYEIWHKPTRKVYTIAKNFDRFLEEPREDPLNLEGFWPCPKPLSATMTNDTLQPVADYIEYQDQAIEIDNLTNRIDLLIKSLKVCGAYDSSNKELGRLLDEGSENKLIPVSSWAAFAEKGGLATAISFLPIKEVGEVLLQLFQARDQIKKDLYEITGIADVIRGQSDPRETAEAVATKGRFGSLRLQARQIAVARFCRDIIRMMGEIIAEHFPDQTLIETSGIMYDEGIGPEPPKPPTPPQPQAAPGIGVPPGIGHNGGPPLAVVPPAGGVQPIVAAAGTAPNGVAGQPSFVPGHSPLGGPLPAQPITPSPLHPPLQPGGQPAPPGAAPQPPMGAPVVPPPDPMAIYAAQLAQFQHDLAAQQAEKSALIMKAIGLLRQDKMRGFRIDIETDSTVETDANEDKAQRVEFVKAVTMFVEQAMQLGAQMPDAVPMMGKMLLFAVRGFRAGRDLESTIEEFVDKSEKDAKARQGQPKPPDPKMQAAQAQAQADEAKAQAEIAKAKIDAQSSADDNQREMASKQMDAEFKRQQLQADQEQMARDAQYKQAEFQMRMAELQMQAKIAEVSHGHAMEQATVAHRQKMETANSAANENGVSRETEPPVQGAERGNDGGWHIRDHFGPGKHGTVVKVVPA
jgi:hypothetical protein